MGVTEVLRTIHQDFPFALYGSILVGVLCAYIGVYVVSKRIVFFGAVMTQLSVLGLAITFLPFMRVPHTIGSLAVTILVVGVLFGFFVRGKLPRDAVLGVVFVVAVAVRILVLQKAITVEAAEIDNLLRGDILFVTAGLFYPLVVVFVLALAGLLLFHKEFLFVTFDPEMAATQGFVVHRWEMALYLIAAVAISVATHMVGDVFVFGFLVIPPAIALLAGGRVKSIFLVAVLVGAVTPAVGLYLAFVLDVPASPAIVSVCALALLFVWIVERVRRS
jgi:ABC-type Mn2+/Zn2+ transport system permease subunit